MKIEHMGNIVIMLKDVSLGNGSKESKLTYELFEKQIKSLINVKALTDLKLKEILFDPEVEFIPLNSNRNIYLPSVSIILPVYNDEDIVITCLETLVQQTYHNVLEIVVVDDGSTDNSLIKLKEFENTHQLVRVIESKHLGRSAARNIGLKNVKGQIVLFSESDAMYAPWYLEKAVEVFLNKNADAVMLQGSWILNASIISKCILALDQIKWEQIKAEKRKVESAWVYKAEIVRQVAGFNKKIESGEDKELLRRINSINAKIEYGTGYNWFHPTPNSLKQYLQRIYKYQRKKVAQYRNQKEFYRLLPVMILILIVCLIITFLRYTLKFLLYFLPYALFTSLILYYFIRLIQLLREQNNVSYKICIFIIPFLSIISIFPKILGIILGNKGIGSLLNDNNMY